MTIIASRTMLLAVLFAGWIVTVPAGTTDAYAAQWLAPAAADHITADWVKQIEADLTGKRFRDLFQAMPVNPPIPAVLRLLNHADKALADNQKEYARSFVDEAVRVLDSGVGKGWYGRADIEPVTAMIRGRAEAAFEGKTVSQGPNPRWGGYSDHKPLGLTNELGAKQQARAIEEATDEDQAAPKTAPKR